MSWGEIIASAAAAVSAACAAYIAWRDNKWRDSDEAKTMNARIKAVEDKTLEHEVKLKDLPSKADLAAVNANVHNLERTVSGIDAGVTRIEQFLMNGSRQ